MGNVVRKLAARMPNVATPVSLVMVVVALTPAGLMLGTVTTE